MPFDTSTIRSSTHLFSSRAHRRLRRSGVFIAALAATGALTLCGDAAAQSLRGSPASLDQQNRHARMNDFTYLHSRSQLGRFVDAGLLVPIKGNANYQLHGVSFPVARPEVRLFIERLSREYRSTCGEPLVVTSLTRPTAFQPANASPRSVHPTGMAIDLRRPADGSCRAWLASTLLYLERQHTLEATLEHYPPHFHVAIFPESYVNYVATTTKRPTEHVLADAADSRSHTVQHGDTLWSIAHEYDTSAAALRRANDLHSSTIHPGQVIVIPRRTSQSS
ncbi:MAG TPA: DUF5715 family protein [Vicinamibacterales bacterium]|nr:DUF5715 family protein [Vicinamibacterales bacterium]